MIKLTNLHKQYGDIHAVKGLSFDVRPGEVLGFLGPNGAGKSTTMRMLTGFVEPTSGEISVFDHLVHPGPLAAQALMGYLPEGAPLYGEMSVEAFLRFVGNIRGLKGGGLETRLSAVVEQVALSQVMSQPIETLSKGFKRRVGLAQALIHDPKILILDEPTDGLDPNQKHQVRTLIQNLSQDKIVIISTHILEEVEALCSRVVIIAGGQMVADDTPRNLARRSRLHQAINLKFTEVPPSFDELSTIQGVAEVEQLDSATFRLYPQPGQHPVTDVSRLIQQRQWQVEELHVEKGRLDDVFRTLTAEVQ